MTMNDVWLENLQRLRSTPRDLPRRRREDCICNHEPPPCSARKLAIVMAMGMLVGAVLASTGAAMLWPTQRKCDAAAQITLTPAMPGTGQKDQSRIPR